MTITLVFMGALMAVVAYWLLRETINVRPWAAEARGDLINPNLGLPPTKIALGVFMAQHVSATHEPHRQPPHLVEYEP